MTVTPSIPPNGPGGDFDSDFHAEVLNDDELAAAIEATAAAAGTTVAGLRSQGHTGRFSSEATRRAWFVIEPLLAASDEGASR